MKQLGRFAGEWAVIDLETTGAVVGQDEIIEFAGIKVKDGQIIDTFQTLIKPAGKIPLKIKRLTGIDERAVEKAPRLDEVLETIRNFIGDHLIVGHNIRFDVSFLEGALGHPLANPVWDTLELARILYPAAPNHRLQTLTALLGLEHRESHRALDDAKGAAQLILNLYTKAADLDLRVIQSLNGFFANINWPGKEFFLAVEKESGPKGLADRESMAQDQGENSLLETSSTTESGEEVAFSLAAIKQILEPGGPLAAYFDHYEERPQQIRMLERVAQALQESKFLVMEAGTGTGKSLAYLIPALYWARSAGEKVVVATHTINLQEQLVAKDLPTLEKVLSFPFKAALVKGRGNYLCRRRWQSKIKEAGRWEEEEAKFYARVLVWLTQTETGDKSELNLYGPQQEYWLELGGDRDSCLGARCPWVRSCFLKIARKKAEEADLLIVNHSLVFSDINAENRVLPEYQYLIFDEAHHLEEEATQHLGKELSYLTLRRYLRSLFQGFGERLHPGVLGLLRQRLAQLPGTQEKGFDKAHLTDALEEAIDKVFEAREGADALFDLLAGLVRTNSSGEEEIPSQILRLKAEHRDLDAWTTVAGAWDNLVIRLGNLVDSLRKLAGYLEEEDTGWDMEFTALVKELQGLLSTGQQIMADLNFLLAGHDPGYVYWIEKTSLNTTLRAAPVKIGPLLVQNLFELKKSVILTSATISVENSFEHFFERIGLAQLPPELVVTEQVESPFCYDKQSLLCLVRDLPNPGLVPDELYIDAMLPFLEKLLQIMEGRTLILFTSHKMLREVYHRLKAPLEAKDICLLGHGIDGSRSKLVADFQTYERCVLLGASSFWEGVDIPGKKLSCVVIAKLPFWPPNLPTVEARLEDLQKNNLDSFRHFTLPKAVLRFKQGFGRLIRTRQDEGVVVILDPRVISHSYGRQFLSSLPVRTHLRGESSLLLQKIASWLAGERISETALNIFNDPEQIKRFLAGRKNQG